MPQTKLSSSYIPGLDGVRALAVVAVVWHHAHPGFRWLPASVNGFLGVDVFFVLSGFLITTLLLNEEASRGCISLRNFYARRFLRIFPLYYALLGILTLYFLLARESSQRPAFFEELAYHATYLSNLINSGSLLAITWSLSTEEQFYLLWPPLLSLLRAKVVLPVLVGFLLLNQALNFGLLDSLLASVDMPYESRALFQVTFTPIILGVLLSFAMQAASSRRWLERTVTPQILWILALALLAVANWPGDVRGWPRLSIHVITALLLGGIVLYPRHGLVRCMEWRPLAYIGTVSYGIYLMHQPVLATTRRILGKLHWENPEAFFIVGLLLSIVAAGFSYEYFEKPLLKMRDRFRSSSLIVESR